MASPLASPVLGSGGGAGAGAGAFDGLTEGFTEKLLSGAVGGGAGMGGGGGSRRSSINRFAEQQSRWGFVPGEEDTLNINMNMPGVFAAVRDAVARSCAWKLEVPRVLHIPCLQNHL
jgi:hypothetical protein